MDISLFKDWLIVIGTMLSVALSLYAVLTKPSKENSDNLEAFEKKVEEKFAEKSKSSAAHDQRIQKLENEMRHLPDKDVVHRLELTMKDMQVGMATMASESQASGRSLRRMEEWLIQKGAEAHERV